MSLINQFEDCLDKHGWNYERQPDNDLNQRTGRCQCPAHGNENSDLNLVYTDTGDKIITYCQVKECPYTEVAKKIGFNASQSQSLFEYPEQQLQQELRQLYPVPQGATCETYLYSKSNGEPVIGVIRLDMPDGTKQFRQGHWDGEQFVKGTRGIKNRPLWNLANVVDADTVVVCEGEKAARAANMRGFVATTNSQGSKCAKLTDWSSLRGKHVIILPDNDENGSKWAQDVLKMLPPDCMVELKDLSSAYSVPEGGDLADMPHISKEDIENLPASVNRAAKGIRFGGIPADEARTGANEPIEWLIEDVMTVDQPTIFGAKEKCLKTTTLSDLSVAVATGTPWLGRFNVPKPRKVLFITGEAGRRSLGRMLDKAMQKEGRENVESLFNSNLRVEAREFPNLPTEQDILDLGAAVRMFDIELVIIDPLYMGLSGISQANMFEVGSCLRRLIEELGDTTVILSHHCRKGTEKVVKSAPDLSELSHAGISAFAGNYWLVGRLTEYDTKGSHDMCVRYGGRDGHFAHEQFYFDEDTWTAEFQSMSSYARQEEVKKRLKDEVDMSEEEGDIDLSEDELPAARRMFLDSPSKSALCQYCFTLVRSGDGDVYDIDPQVIKVAREKVLKLKTKTMRRQFQEMLGDQLVVKYENGNYTLEGKD